MIWGSVPHIYKGPFGIATQIVTLTTKSQDRRGRVSNKTSAIVLEDSVGARTAVGLGFRPQLAVTLQIPTIHRLQTALDVHLL